MSFPEGFKPASKEEHKKAVQEGRSLPTPDFAMEEGDEMLETLQKEIKNFNENQLNAFLKLLEDLKKNEPTGSLAEKIPAGSILPSVFGFGVVAYLTNNPGWGVLGGGVTKLVFDAPLSSRWRNLWKLAEAAMDQKRARNQEND